MKLVRFGAPGQERPGLIDGAGRIRDLSREVTDIAGAALAPDALARLRTYDPESLPLAADDVRIGPCVGGVGKFIAVGLNYADHAADAKLPIPPEPVLFMKATSCIVGPNDDVLMPRGARKLDWEVELGIVIGRQAAYVSEAEALDYVAGYCVVNDVSEREYQLERSGQWMKGKSCDTFGPIGPWLVTADEVPDPQALDLWLDVDGKRYQEGSTRDMIFGVATLVSYTSRFMSLHPGDVITTGTPAGIGLAQTPQRFLQPGERMRLGISGLGEQAQRVVGA